MKYQLLNELQQHTSCRPQRRYGTRQLPLLSDQLCLTNCRYTSPISHADWGASWGTLAPPWRCRRPAGSCLAGQQPPVWLCVMLICKPLTFCTHNLTANEHNRLPKHSCQPARKPAPQLTTCHMNGTAVANRTSSWQHAATSCHFDWMRTLLTMMHIVKVRSKTAATSWLRPSAVHGQQA